jgi:hypothetical protein
MRGMLSLAVAVVALPMVCGPGPAGAFDPGPPDELPFGWNAAEIEGAAPPYHAGGQAYVLAWVVIEDDRPFRVESCLVLRVLDRDDGHGQWSLAHVYRHPLLPRPAWRVGTAHQLDDDFIGHWVWFCRRLPAGSGNAGVYAALSDVDWHFENRERWRVLGCRVCERNWEVAVGERPTRFFGR